MRQLGITNLTLFAPKSKEVNKMAVENKLKSFAFTQNIVAKTSWLFKNDHTWPFDALLEEIISQPALLLNLDHSD
jgi:hypothetical protein